MSVCTSQSTEPSNPLSSIFRPAFTLSLNKFIVPFECLFSHASSITSISIIDFMLLLLMMIIILNTFIDFNTLIIIFNKKIIFENDL